MFPISGFSAGIIMAALVIFAIFGNYGQLGMVCYGYNAQWAKKRGQKESSDNFKVKYIQVISNKMFIKTNERNEIPM